MNRKTIRSINLTVENVGKVVKFTKKRYSWTLLVDGREFLVVYSRSSMSGKDRVVVNGQTLHEKVEHFRTELNLQLPFEGCVFAIVEKNSRVKLYVDGRDFDELFGNERVKSILKKNKREEEQEQLTLSQLQREHLDSKPQSPPGESNQGHKKCLKKVHFDLEKNATYLLPHLSYASDHGGSQQQQGEAPVHRTQTGFGHLNFPHVLPVQVLESSDLFEEKPQPPAFAFQSSAGFDGQHQAPGFRDQDFRALTASRFEHPLQQTHTTHKMAPNSHSPVIESCNENLFDSMVGEAAQEHQAPRNRSHAQDEERGWHTDRPAQSRAFLPVLRTSPSLQGSQEVFQSQQPSLLAPNAGLASGWTGQTAFGSYVSQEQQPEQPVSGPSSVHLWPQAQTAGHSFTFERPQSSGYHAPQLYRSAAAPPISPLKSGLGGGRAKQSTGNELAAPVPRDARASWALQPEHQSPLQPRAQTGSFLYDGQSHAQLLQSPGAGSFAGATSGYFPAPPRAPFGSEQPVYEPTAVGNTLFASQSEASPPLDLTFNGGGWAPGESVYQQQQQRAGSGWTYQQR